MKKMVYAIVLTLVCILSLSACTEQNIKPQGGGPAGSAIDPKG